MAEHTETGWVKSVSSGDTVVIRGRPFGGPPPVRTLSLAYIQAPRLARHPGKNDKEGDGKSSVDEPFAWAARERVRLACVGKEVQFRILYSSGNRDYGAVAVGSQDLASLLVADGLASVRSTKSPDSHYEALAALEIEAKNKTAGMWTKANSALEKAVRSIQWSVENPAALVAPARPYDGVVEQVRDGSSLRVFLLPAFQDVTVNLSGIKCPSFKGKANIPDAFAEEARYYAEVRLMQRSVKVYLESHVSANTFMGTILHPQGNIAEGLLQEGMARVVDWSLSCVSVPQGREKLRKAESEGKKRQLRLFKDYVPSASPAVDERQFTAKVVEILSGEMLVVSKANGELCKVALASVRQPKPDTEFSAKVRGVTAGKHERRTVFEVPWMYEAKEFLRSRLLGRKVSVTVDYIKTGDSAYPDKMCCTVLVDHINIGEALLSKGLGTCVRHRHDDEDRASNFDDLVAAEQRAEKSKKGLHRPVAEAPVHRVTDISNAKLAKQFAPMLQRHGEPVAGVVERVFHGSRLKVYLPKDSVLVSVLLAGVSCPRGPWGDKPGEPFAEEAAAFTRELCMQRDVLVRLDSPDQNGNFIGTVMVDKTNVSLALVSAGLASIHPSANRQAYRSELYKAEKRCKEQRLKIWENYVEVVEAPEEPKERQVKYTEVLVVYVIDPVHIWVQDVDKAPELEKLMMELNEAKDKTPAPALKKGDLCAARFVDGLWYRAKVVKTSKDDKTVDVFYIDYGNEDCGVPAEHVAVLPAQFHDLPPAACDVHLALICAPTESHWRAEAVEWLRDNILQKKLRLNREVVEGGKTYVTLTGSEDGSGDVGRALVAEGLATVERSREPRLRILAKEYGEAKKQAREGRKNMWEFGDFEEDDAKEFGYTAPGKK